MSRVLLIHWNSEEATQRAAQLRAAGHDAEPYTDQGLDNVFEDPPDVFVIDLSRLPANGRAVATLLRKKKSTRQIPIIFAGRDSAKLANTNSEIPHTAYARWSAIGEALRWAGKKPDKTSGNGHPHRSVAKRLGIRSGTRLALFGEPEGFVEALGPLPPDARFLKSARGANLSVLFVTAFANLKRRFAMATHGMAEDGAVWVVWPKKGCAVATDLTEDVVRAFGLGAGWTDTKEMVIDKTWRGMRFSRSKRASHHRV